jgi:hypothetical protein
MLDLHCFRYYHYYYYLTVFIHITFENKGNNKITALRTILQREIEKQIEKQQEIEKQREIEKQIEIQRQNEKQRLIAKKMTRNSLMKFYPCFC